MRRSAVPEASICSNNVVMVERTELCKSGQSFFF